jgi:hypothetical protein
MGRRKGEDEQPVTQKGENPDKSLETGRKTKKNRLSGLKFPKTPPFSRIAPSLLGFLRCVVATCL